MLYTIETKVLIKPIYNIIPIYNLSPDNLEVINKKPGNTLKVIKYLKPEENVIWDGKLKTRNFYYITINDTNGWLYKENCKEISAIKLIGECCPVCFSDLTTLSQYLHTVCGHVLCKYCKQKVQKCPICREDVKKNTYINIPIKPIYV